MADALFAQLASKYGFSTLNSPTNHTVDASNEGYAVVFESFTDQPITRGFYRYGSRTGTPPEFIAALEGVDASGNPDGVVKGGGTPCSVVFTPPASSAWDGLGQWVTFDNAYTPALGERLAFTIRYSSGTIDGSNNSSFTRSMVGTSLDPALPYSLTNSGGTWSKVTTAFMAPFGYATASKRFGVPCYGTWSTQVSTSGHRQACGFTLPVAFGTTFRPIGMQLNGRLGSAGNTAKVAVWDASGTEIASANVIDADHQASPTNQRLWHVAFTSPPTLNCGTKYYFGVESVSGSAVNLAGYLLTESDDRVAWPLGINRVFASWDGSAWTETNTTLPLLDLILDDITVSSGGGGSVLIGGGLSLSGVGVH